MLKARLITALVGLPIVLLAFVYGPWWFIVLFIMACMTLSIFEAAGMLIPTFELRLAGHGAGAEEVSSVKRLAASATSRLPALATAIGWLMLLLTANSEPTASVGIIAIGMLAALLIGCFSSRDVDLSAARAFGMLTSLAYAALPWIVVWHLFLMAPHSRYILLVMAVTWLGDTGGYFGGRYYGGKIFGNRKLAPTISPKKTWEGAVAGLALSVVGGLVLNVIFVGELGSFGLIALCGLLGGVSAMIGDLVESMLKRFAKVKDSGTIIPGHGGFLDRVDGILFAAPVIWALLHYLR
jgi:phosphatidate cytidylyltransferase